MSSHLVMSVAQKIYHNSYTMDFHNSQYYIHKYHTVNVINSISLTDNIVGKITLIAQFKEFIGFVNLIF